MARELRRDAVKEDNIMNRRTILSSKALWLVLILGLSLLFLLGSPLRVNGVEPTEGIVSGQSAQGYRFMTGGIGTEERNEMMQLANQYDLVLSFAARSGKYLSDVNVVITDSRGREVVNTISAGPLFYAELPRGRYNIKVTYAGRSEEIRDLEVSSGHLVSKVFHWNIPENDLARNDDF